MKFLLISMAWLPLLSLAIGAAGCKKPEPGPVWTPDDVYRAPSGDASAVNGRDLLDLRGLIHTHSPYSHDACDGEPRDPNTDLIDDVCFDDLRRGICQVRHDFIMLTDHRDSHSRTEYPEVLLYREDLGDLLVERDRGPVGNFIPCEGGERTLVMAGTEAGTMSVALEGHVSPDSAERSRIYGSTDAVDMEIIKTGGGVVLAQHTESWTDAELIDKPFDGFEMFNVHANLFLNFGKALELITDLETPEVLPHPEVILLTLISDDPTYLGRWSRVLASGAHRVTTMATDSHRNTFRDLLQDGERIDSFRRLMRMFSNHLLVRPEADGSWDDRHLRAALQAGRLYGAFEYLGFPEGFDFRAESGSTMFEMGESVSLGLAPSLEIQAPTVRDLDPAVQAPEISVHLLRATPEGWVEEATGRAALSFTPTEPGAYRAEVRIRPLHLHGYLGDREYLVDEETFTWIYANAIYLEP